jgi:single-strand DNA-binding protein
MVNKVILIGRLGKDPEVRYTMDGGMICNFSVATDRGYGDKKKTDWHNIVTFKKTAEFCSTYLVKGAKVFIEGVIAYQEWEKDGEKKYKTEIIANNVQALSEKKASGMKPDDVPF